MSEEIGKRIDRQDVEAAFSQPDPRDAFTPDERLRAYDELDAMRSLLEVIGDSHVLLNGDMGSGMSLVASTLTSAAHQAGRSVYSTRDSGIVIGRRIEMDEILTLEAPALIVIEGSDFLRWGGYDRDPERFISFKNRLIPMRKMGIQVVFVQRVTRRELMRTLRASFGVELVVDRQPRKRSGSKMWRATHHFDPLDKEDVEVGREFPDWCYIHCYTLRVPSPSLAEKMPAPGYRLYASVLDDLSSALTENHVVHHFSMPPRVIHEAAKLLDIFSNVQPDRAAEKAEAQ